VLVRVTRARVVAVRVVMVMVMVILAVVKSTDALPESCRGTHAVTGVVCRRIVAVTVPVPTVIVVVAAFTGCQVCTS
jgi:hypothetical protein